jgi:hypothetical protein
MALYTKPCPLWEHQGKKDLQRPALIAVAARLFCVASATPAESSVLGCSKAHRLPMRTLNMQQHRVHQSASRTLHHGDQYEGEFDEQLTVTQEKRPTLAASMAADQNHCFAEQLVQGDLHHVHWHSPPAS